MYKDGMESRRHLAQQEKGDDAEFSRLKELLRDFEDVEVVAELRSSSSASATTGVDMFVYVVLAMYGVLLLVGVIGNVGVLARIAQLVVGKRVCRQSTSTFIYVGTLCLIDVVFLATLVPMAVKQLHGAWPFGAIACRLYLFVESSGRTVNGYLLLVICVERYVAVRFPQRCHRLRCGVVALALACGACLGALLLNIPVLMMAKQTRIYDEPVLQLVDEPQPTYGVPSVNGTYSDLGPRQTNKLRVVMPYVYGCVLSASAAASSTYDVSSLEADTLLSLLLSVVGFLLPFVVSFGLYVHTYILLAQRDAKRRQSSHHARRRTSSASSTSIQQFKKRVGLRTLGVATFHIACYLPYWLFTVSMVLIEGYVDPNAHARTVNSVAFIVIMYGIHALPFVNSSANWVFYGLLNTQLNGQNSTSIQPPLMMTSQRAKSLARGRSVGHSAAPPFVSRNQRSQSEVGGAAMVEVHTPGEQLRRRRYAKMRDFADIVNFTRQELNRHQRRSHRHRANTTCGRETVEHKTTTRRKVSFRCPTRDQSLSIDTTAPLLDATTVVHTDGTKNEAVKRQQISSADAVTMSSDVITLTSSDATTTSDSMTTTRTTTTDSDRQNCMSGDVLPTEDKTPLGYSTCEL